jgi:transposase
LIGFTWPSTWAKRWTGSEKKITRDYKQGLTKEQRQEFRARMWEFRRRWEDLTNKEKRKLKELFAHLPRLQELYRLRGRFQRIFDTAPDRAAAERRLSRLFAQMQDRFPDLDRFLCTFETWWDQILNYFDARQSSGPVEGINNKARVIVKRCYGLKSADSLWTRLILDLNRAKDIALYTIAQVQNLVTGFRTFFLQLCT